jgi:hypothetical protein
MNTIVCVSKKEYMSLKARYSLATLDNSRIDAEAGIIRDVSIMSAGPALGHGMRADLTTLQSLLSLANGGGVKAFLNHDFMPKPTDAAGVFSGFYIEAEKDGNPAKLRATFKALNAFRNHSPREYATLFELAETAPSAFGVSVSIYQDIEDAQDGGDPFIRPVAFDSADFVSTPAANKSLFSIVACIDGSDTKPADVSTEAIQQDLITQPQRSNLSQMLKKVYSKFSGNQAALARAVKFMAENPDATEETAVDAVEKELSAEETAALIAENAALKSKVDELTNALSEAGLKVEELSKSAAELPSAKDAVAAKDTELSALKEQLSAATKRLARYGVSAVKTEKLSSEKPSGSTMTLSEFNSLSHKDRNAHMASGGKITQ